ncbi:MAG: lipid-A-disaccharide synthase, partial [Achromobacter kerstersii]
MNTRIGMVAGEPSGDLLAGRIIAGLQAREAGVRCEGIGGPQMQAREFDTWHPMHALTVFGYVDALK